MNWKAFAEAAPGLAKTGEKLLDGPGVLLLGTVRQDGGPRISPVEPVFGDGELYLGMMWRSLKALDLLRDPRCTVHNAICDRMAPDGELKLQGRAREVVDLKVRARYGDLLYEKIGWRPEEPRFHLFTVTVERVGLFVMGDGARTVTRWRAGGRVETFEQTP